MKMSEDDKEEKTRLGNTAVSYTIASIVCLIVTLRFLSTGDDIGTGIYSAGTLSFASAAVVRYLNRK